MDKHLLAIRLMRLKERYKLGLIQALVFVTISWNVRPYSSPTKCLPLKDYTLQKI